MTELDSLRALEKYDAWKKAKQSRKRWIKLMASLIGGLIGLLLTWAILRVGAGGVWTLTKATFASEEKILEHEPKVKVIDEKLKKSIMAKPLKWVSKKMEEEVAKSILKGDFSAAITAFRTYCIILIAVWLLIWGLIWTIFYWLSYWIIGSFIWLEPRMTEQSI